mmetsp:Transcript_13915/g.19043  ORF Transcript_13915/g.19043 Transcript_13915/m.19043 type:complete len:122 (+) Transcript_13915:764-1129(+)
MPRVLSIMCLEPATKRSCWVGRIRMRHGDSEGQKGEVSWSGVLVLERMSAVASAVEWIAWGVLIACANVKISSVIVFIGGWSWAFVCLSLLLFCGRRACGAFYGVCFGASFSVRDYVATAG